MNFEKSLIANATRRVQAAEREKTDGPPKPPRHRWHYDPGLIKDFYYDWKRANGVLTPDGKCWLEQDKAWWTDVWAFAAWDEWAEWQAKHPVKPFGRIKPGEVVVK